MSWEYTTHTHIYTHPTPEHSKHTHTHSLWSTRALVQMAPPCVDSVGSYWLQKTSVTPMKAVVALRARVSVCVCVCVCVRECEPRYAPKVIHYLNEALAVLQGDGVIYH